MAEVNAGEIKGKLSIETGDLDRLRSEAAKTGQALKSELSGKAAVAPAAIESIKAATSEYSKLGSAGKASFDSAQVASTQLKTSVDSAKAATVGLGSAFSNMAGALGASLGAVGLVAFVKSIVNIGDKLSDLHEQTRISIELLGGLRPIAETSGSSIEQFAKGISLAQKNLGAVNDESKGVAQGLKAIGLSVDELIRLSPDEFIEKLARGLGSIQNPAQRAHLTAQILGRSFQELGPTISAIAENGLPRLSEETAAAYKNLGQLKDQVDALKIKFQDLAATGITAMAKLFGIISLPPIEEVGKLQLKIDQLGASLARIRGMPKELIDAKTIDQLKAMEKSIPDQGALSNLISPSGKKTLQDLIAAREQQEKILATVNQTKVATTGNPLGLGKADDLKKLQNEVGSFLDGLQKALSAIQVKTVEIKLGPEAGLKATLDAQFDAFTEGLRSKQLPIPKGLHDFFVLLRDKIVDANKELQRTTFETARIDEIAKALSQDSAEWLTVSEDLAKRAADALDKLEPKFRDLQKTLAVEILPPEQQNRARTFGEFEDRVKAINEWRDAAISTGQDVQQVNEEAAQATTDAWVTANEKMREQSDETSEFTRRAFERGFDAVSDVFRDLLDNGFKNFGDFAEKIRRTINSLVADAATQELKDIFLGKDFGKKGAGIGGIFGDLFGTNKAAPEKLQGTTAADTLDAEFGQQLRAAQSAATDTTAIASIQAQAATAQTGIQALLAEGQAVLQASTATAQTVITAMETTAVSSITAVEAVAIAGIQAAAAAAGLTAPTAAPGGAAPGLLGALASLFRKTPLDAGPQSAGGGLLALGYAEGGRMWAGDIGIVGERGREIWKPDRAGSVIPLQKMMAASGETVVHFHVHGVTDADSFRRSRAQILADLSRAVEKGNKHR